MTQLDYIKLDTAFFDKPKIKGLGFRHGQEAIVFLIRLLCAMGRSTDAVITDDAWGAIAGESQIDVTKAAEIVSYCLTVGILAGRAKQITNTRIIDDQASLRRKRELGRMRVQSLRARVKESAQAQPVGACGQVATERGHESDEVECNDSAVVAADDNEHSDDPVLRLATKKLETPSNQQWTKDNRFILAGRRPMRDYPLVWLTPRELADVIQKLEASDIPSDSYKDLFLKAQSKLSTYAAQGRSHSVVSVYNWLTGFFFDELLEKTIKETRLTNALQIGGVRNGNGR